MKRKGILVDLVIGTEYERMSIVSPHNGNIVFEGNISDAMSFLSNEIAKFKNSPDKSDIDC